EEDGECDVHATGSGRHQIIGRLKSEPVRPLPPIPRRRSRRKHAQFASTRSKTRTHGRSRAMQMKDMRASIYETLRSLRHREKNRDSQRQRLHQREPLSIGRTAQTYNSIEQLLGSSSICPPDGSIPDLNAANVTSWTLDHFQGHFNDNVRQTSNMGAEPSPRIYDTRQQASPNRSIVVAPSTIIGNTRHSISSNSSKRTPSSIRVVNISDHNSNKRAPPSVRMADITRQASANSSMRAAPEKPFSDITYGLFPLPPPPELLLDIHNHSTLPVGHTLTDRQTASQTLVRPRPDYQPATRTWKSVSTLRLDGHANTIQHHSGTEHYSGGQRSTGNDRVCSGHDLPHHVISTPPLPSPPPCHTPSSRPPTPPPPFIDFTPSPPPEFSDSPHSTHPPTPPPILNYSPHEVNFSYASAPITNPYPSYFPNPPTPEFSDSTIPSSNCSSPGLLSCSSESAPRCPRPALHSRSSSDSRKSRSRHISFRDDYPKRRSSFPSNRGTIRSLPVVPDVDGNRHQRAGSDSDLAKVIARLQSVRRVRGRSKDRIVRLLSQEVCRFNDQVQPELKQRLLAMRKGNITATKPDWLVHRDYFEREDSAEP
ncbi:hypothetical protein LSAT2_020724, partial [Lamellibrachia satsuma]